MEQLNTIAAGARHRRRTFLPGYRASAGPWLEVGGSWRRLDSSVDGHAVG